MRILISEEDINNATNFKGNKTKFYSVPDDIFDLMKRRIYSDADNRGSMAMFKGKNGKEYLIVKQINSSTFEAYDLIHLRGFLLKRGKYLPEPIAIATFDVNHVKKFFSGYSSNESILVQPEYRRLGIASAITDFAENYYKMPYKPSKLLSPDMQAFVKNREKP